MINLDVMHSKPGIYCVMTRMAIAFVETDNHGRCWQLNPKNFVRDGEMRPGIWNLPAICEIFGPLARPDESPK